MTTVATESPHETTGPAPYEGQQRPPPTQEGLHDSVILFAGILMGIVGVGGYIFWALSGGLVREGNWIGVDFHVYYQVAQVLRRGEDIYTAGIAPPYVYPPLLAALVVPLTVLPWTEATMAWKMLQHLWLVLAGWMLVSLLPVRIRPLAVGLLLLGGLTVPLRDELQVGESNSLILVLVAGALWLIARDDRQRTTDDGPPDTPANPIVNSGHPNSSHLSSVVRCPSSVLAALLLALAAAIKVLPVLLIAYFWWRGPRMVAAVATGAFLLLQLLLFALTPSTADYWFVQFPALFGQAFPFLDNQSINAFLSRALLPGANPIEPSTQIASGEALRPVLTWALNLTVVVATALVLWRTGRRPWPVGGPWANVRFLLEVGLVLLTTHLVSGSTWMHHLVMLSIPLLGLLGAWWLGMQSPDNETPPTRRTMLYALTIGGTFAALLNRPEGWVYALSAAAPNRPLLALLASSVGMWVVVGLWVAVVVTLFRQSRKEQPREVRS